MSFGLWNNGSKPTYVSQYQNRLVCLKIYILRPILMNQLSDIFIGIQVCVAIQLMAIAIVNIYSANSVRNVFFGVYCLIIAQSPFILYFSTFLKGHLIMIILFWAWKGFFYGPLLYLYLSSLSRERLHPKTWITHLTIPFFLYLMSVYNSGFVEGGTSTRFILNQIKYYSYWSLTIFYFILGWRSFKRYLSHSLEPKSKARYWTFYSITNTHLLLAVLPGLLFVLNKQSSSDWINQLSGLIAKPFYDYLVGPFYLILFLFLLFFGITELTWFKRHFTKNAIHLDDFEGSLDSKTASLQIKDQILSNKLHRRNALTVTDLANISGLTQKTIKKLIEYQGFGRLGDYINFLRIEEIKENLMKDEFSNYDFMSVARESGFTSKATFYRVFRKHTGQTPSDFLRGNPQ